MIGFVKFKVILAIFQAKILHPNRVGYLRFEFLKDLGIRFLFKDSSQGVEVPVVVVIECVRRVAPSFWTRIFHRLDFAGCLMIDARTGFQQVSYGRLLFLGRQSGCKVIDVQLLQRGIQINGSPVDVNTVKRSEEGFSYGMDREISFDVPP